MVAPRRYVRPERDAASIKRRVYNLPREMVARIHAYGLDVGHQSEVSAVRELLDAALGEYEHQKVKLSERGR